MKTIFSTLTIALFCLIATSQANDVFSEQLKGDAMFLRLGSNGDDDCYSLKFGEVIHDGSAAQQISSADFNALLGTTPVIVAKKGCAAVAAVNPVSMTVTYSNGYVREFSVEEMQVFTETPGMAEKMLHTALSATFTNISFSDEAGTAHTLDDKVFEIK
jgi:hypothetical protein